MGREDPEAHGVLGDFTNMEKVMRILFSESSGSLFTPASFKIDPRFAGMGRARPMQALLAEFARLDHSQVEGAPP